MATPYPVETPANSAKRPGVRGLPDVAATEVDPRNVEVMPTLRLLANEWTREHGSNAAVWVPAQPAGVPERAVARSYK
jgi:hypothetical protein